MSRPIVLTCLLILLVVVGLLPMLAMLWNSIVVDGRLDFSAYRGLLASSREWMLLGNSLALAAAVTLLASAVGVSLGVLFGKTDLPFRRFFTAAFAIPLLIPSYVTAVGWAEFAGAEGALGRIAGAAVAREASVLLFGFPGCVAVLFSVSLPIVLLLTLASLTAINPRLEEACRLIAGWRGVLRRITLPLAAPSIVFSALLVFLLAIGEFGVPNFLRFDVFAVESFVQFSAFYDFRAATAAAAPMALIPCMLLLAEWKFATVRVDPLQAIPGGTPQAPIPLGRWKIPLLAAVALLFALLVGAPLLILLGRSLSLSAYAGAMRLAADSLLRSLLYAFIGATLLAMIGFLAGYLIRFRAMPLWKAADALTVFAFALPGTVTGIGLVSLWNNPGTGFIYGSFAMIMLAYLGKYIVLTSRISAAALAGVPESMEKAGQIAGLSWARRIRFLLVPMTKKGILAAWLVGYIFCLRDFETTMIVYPAGHDTLPVRIATLMANGSPELISALCVLMILVTLLPPGLLWSLKSLSLGR